MPLHLLGKKSWNVYNQDNVERVRRDEAEAEAREEAEEQRMQEADAARRIALLRGEEPPALPVTTATTATASAEEGGESGRRRKRSAEDGVGRKRDKKLRGEDDTDAAIRRVREDAEAGERARHTLHLRHDGKQNDAPLVDDAGHLQLIPAPDEKTIRRAAKNAEAEAEKAQKKKRDEDQYTMRFSNAAGFNNSMQQKPWYSAPGDVRVASGGQDKDVWGNEDPRRRERNMNRVTSNDPFAAMQSAQRQLKQSERDRDAWKKGREVEIEELKREEKRRRREKRDHRRRHGDRDEREDDLESLEGFSLDAPREDERRRRSDHDRERRRHHHHHRRRSRSRSRERLSRH